MSSVRLAWSLGLVLVMTAPLRAQSPAVDTSRQQGADPRWTTASGRSVRLFPSGDVFPVYTADPHRPTNAIVARFYSREGIPESGGPRVWLSAGGRFGLLRIDTASPSERSWQVNLEAGLDGVFDTEFKSELIGLDGNYGLTLTTASNAPWAVKVGFVHTSAHIGDEYSERTGRRRSNYIREEAAVGLWWFFTPRWRAYAEVGGAYSVRLDDQQPWRLQTGLEYETAPRLWGGRGAWYVASDLTSWEERHWRVDTTIQVGVVTRVNGRAYRLMLEYFDGRPQLAEFFRYTETSLAFGFRFDP
jgi:hypothetical protein